MSVPGAFEQAHLRLDRRVGLRLFTVLEPLPERGRLRRRYSSHPAEFPMGGAKTLPGITDWYVACVDRGEPVLGADRAALRAAFFDHELIESLGCGAFLNIPVVDGDRTALILCLLDAEHAYTADSLAAAVAETAELVPDLLSGTGTGVQE